MTFPSTQRPKNSADGTSKTKLNPTMKMGHNCFQCSFFCIVDESLVGVHKFKMETRDLERPNGISEAKRFVKVFIEAKFCVPRGVS